MAVDTQVTADLDGPAQQPPVHLMQMKQHGHLQPILGICLFPPAEFYNGAAFRQDACTHVAFSCQLPAGRPGHGAEQCKGHQQLRLRSVRCADRIVLNINRDHSNTCAASIGNCLLWRSLICCNHTSSAALTQP